MAVRRASGDSSGQSQVYQFISDPGHKENLSGRVRAACLTCRRKKIKCSGTSPCLTCSERGVQCEGLTSRKRPRRGSKGSNAQESPKASGSRTTFAAISSTQRDHSRARNIAIQATRPTEALQRLHTENDSGYGTSLQHGGDDSVDAGWENASTVFPLMSPSTDFGDSAPVSPATLHDWSFIGARANSEYCPTETTDSNATTTLSASVSATSLITAARALEEQAQSLRQLASQQTVPDSSRRQTVALPLQPVHLLLPNDPGPYPQSSYDDMFLINSDRMSGSGITPRAAEYSSWWDVNARLSPGTTSQPGADRIEQVLTPPLEPADATSMQWRGSQSLPQRLGPARLEWDQQRPFGIVGMVTDEAAVLVANNSRHHHHGTDLALPGLDPRSQVYPWAGFDGV